jgi:hypothetical protein
MAQRFACKAAAVAQGGTTFVHALGGDPTIAGEYEWQMNLCGPNPGASGLYRTTITSQNFVVCASGAAGTGDIFVSRQHTIVR